MQSLKTYLLEGLIQAALLLSLCGVRVQVEPEGSPLEPGPTSALPPLTHLHNLRNALDEGGTGLHPKSPDLDQFFTARRLLGWVRSLDRLQVPRTELETWLVQQDPAPLPVRLLHSAPDRLILPQQSRDQEWEEPGDEWEEPEPEHTQVDRGHEEAADLSSPETRGTEDWDEGDSTEEQQSSVSLQECLRLLESFPLSPAQQACPTGSPRTESPPTDVEQRWQDLIDLMEPQGSDVDMLDLLEQPQAEEGRPLMEGNVLHGLSEPTDPSDQELVPLVPGDQELVPLVPLVPSDQELVPLVPGDQELVPLVPSDQELVPLVPSDQLDDVPSAPAPLHTSRRLSLLPEDLPPSLLLDEGELEELLGDTDMLEDLSLLELDLQEDESFSLEMTHRLQQEGYLDPELTQRTSRLSLDAEGNTEENVERNSRQTEEDTIPDASEELDSDSGLSLDSSHSPPSPSGSEASSYSSSSSSSAPSPLSSGPSPMELEVTIKEEPLDEEELGAVGGHCYPQEDSKHVFSPPFHQKLFEGFPWLQQVTHDHTYNQPSQLPPKTSSRHLRPSPRHDKPYKISQHQWDRDERHARALKIPFSNELIINLPVEEFNDLLASYRLDDDQLSLIRDIRRRGKNKIAAQNCRKRKMDTLTGLEKDVTLLRRRRTQLLKERQEALRTLQELKQRLDGLYQDVFSSLRDERGEPLDVNEYVLSFEADGGVDVVSRRRGGKDKSRRKKK